MKDYQTDVQSLKCSQLSREAGAESPEKQRKICSLSHSRWHHELLLITNVQRLKWNGDKHSLDLKGSWRSSSVSKNPSMFPSDLLYLSHQAKEDYFKSIAKACSEKGWDRISLASDSFILFVGFAANTPLFSLFYRGRRTLSASQVGLTMSESLHWAQKQHINSRS